VGVRGSVVAAGFAFGAAIGFLAGLFLAISAAELVPGDRPVIFTAVGLGDPTERRSRPCVRRPNCHANVLVNPALSK